MLTTEQRERPPQFHVVTLAVMPTDNTTRVIAQQSGRVRITQITTDCVEYNLYRVTKRFSGWLHPFGVITGLYHDTCGSGYLIRFDCSDSGNVTISYSRHTCMDIIS